MHTNYNHSFITEGQTSWEGDVPEGFTQVEDTPDNTNWMDPTVAGESWIQCYYAADVAEVAGDTHAVMNASVGMEALEDSLS